MPGEKKTTIEGIDASLDELVKAADATDLLKAYGGVAVDTYGHHDERGDVPGKLADTGDMGSLDSMMIGKMGDALISAGFPADAVTAFMSAFQEEEEEEEEEEAAKMGKPADSSGGVGTNARTKPAAGGSTMAKSMDQFRADPDLADSLDVSPFLEALTARTAEQLDHINKSLHGFSTNQANVNRAQAVATYNLGQLVKGIHEVNMQLAQRLGFVEQQPNAPRGHTMVGAQPLNKGMPREVGAPEAGQPLNKSQVLATLSYMNLEKGIKEISGVPTSTVIGTYEAGGQLTQQSFDAVQGFLAAHPHEAEVAVGYR